MRGRGVCMAEEGMAGMHAWWAACKTGVCEWQGHVWCEACVAWVGALQRTVCILLECILVEI